MIEIDLLATGSGTNGVVAVPVPELVEPGATPIASGKSWRDAQQIVEVGSEEPQRWRTTSQDEGTPEADLPVSASPAGWELPSGTDETELVETVAIDERIFEAESGPAPEIVEPAPDATSVETDAEGQADAQPEQPIDAAQEGEPCSQCGSSLAPSDIFCGSCGFVRRPAEGEAVRTRDTAAYDPFPWGSPRDEPAASAPVFEEPAPVVRADAHPDVEQTRIVGRNPRGDTFVLQFSTGENVTIAGTGLVGRNPLAEPGEYFDTLVAIIDPGKSVSKTHVEFGQESGAFWVSDRYSANGTVMREPNQPARRAEAGKRYRIVRGTRVDIGEQFFIVS